MASPLGPCGAPERKRRVSDEQRNGTVITGVTLCDALSPAGPLPEDSTIAVPVAAPFLLSGQERS